MTPCHLLGLAKGGRLPPLSERCGRWSVDALRFGYRFFARSSAQNRDSSLGALLATRSSLASRIDASFPRHFDGTGCS